MATRERVALLLLALLSLSLRVVEFFRYRFDSDEPQHLHVAWGWTQGLVQYRDLFDNHAPLFHLLTAPLLAAFGERPGILFFMRAAMVPLFAGVLVCTWLIVRKVCDERAAAWTVVLLSLFPTFFLKSLEFRTDNLWNCLWMLAVACLLCLNVTLPVALLIGLLLGIAFSVSLKTTLLVITLMLAMLGTELLTRSERRWGRIISLLVCAAAGASIVPMALLWWFQRAGALENLFYCVFTFNELLTRTRSHLWIPRAIYPFAFIAAGWISWRFARTRTFDDSSRRRFFLGTALAWFSITLICFWVLISPRDLLPILPFLLMFAVRWILTSPRASGRSIAILVATGLTFAGFVAYYGTWLRWYTAEQTTMIEQVLQLTRPGEMLMDYKGETIYRRRPFYYIFELIGRSQIGSGLIDDTVAEAMVKNECHVVQADGPFYPPRARAFLQENYVDVGRLRVSGQWLGGEGHFSIAVPGDYVILSDMGITPGSMDGAVPGGGPWHLQAGQHQFVSAVPPARLACVWAPAWQRGFSPFHHRGLDFR